VSGFERYDGGVVQAQRATWLRSRVLTVAPNMRLKLRALVLKEAVVSCAGGHGTSSTASARTGGRPQLKRDPLAATNYAEIQRADLIRVRTMFIVAYVALATACGSMAHSRPARAASRTSVADTIRATERDRLRALVAGDSGRASQLHATTFN